MEEILPKLNVVKKSPFSKYAKEENKPKQKKIEIIEESFEEIPKEEISDSDLKIQMMKFPSLDSQKNKKKGSVKISRISRQSSDPSNLNSMSIQEKDAREENKVHKKKALTPFGKLLRKFNIKLNNPKSKKRNLFLELINKKENYSISSLNSPHHDKFSETENSLKMKMSVNSHISHMTFKNKNQNRSERSINFPPETLGSKLSSMKTMNRKASNLSDISNFSNISHQKSNISNIEQTPILEEKKIGFFAKISFSQYSKLFNSKQETKRSDMLSLAKEKKMKNIQKMLAGVVAKIHLEDKKTINSSFDLIKLTILPYLKKAIFYETIEQILTISLIFQLILFIKEMKKPNENSNSIFLFLSPGIFFLLYYSRFLVKQYSFLYTNQCASTASQVLRYLIFEKLITSSVSFLRSADVSLITKLSIFQFETIIEFVNKIPDFTSFPLTMILTSILMTLILGWFAALVNFFIFLLVSITLVFLIKCLSKKNLEYEKISSRRHKLVDEITDKMADIKFNLIEEYYKNMILKLRKKEVKLIESVFNLRTFAKVLMSLSTFFSIFAVIWVKNQFKGDKEGLSLTETIAIISVISSLSTPLKNFVEILEQYYRFTHAIGCLDYFLFGISNKPLKELQDDSLIKGAIVCFECESEIEDYEEMREIFDFLLIGGMEKKGKNSMKKRWEKKNSDKKKEALALTESFGESSVSSTSFYDFEELSIIYRIKKIFKMKKNLEIFHLRRNTTNADLNFKILPCDKVYLLGSENSGKFEFMLTLLGETMIREGNIKLKGKITFSDALDPHFLCEQSLKDNILMGKKLKMRKFHKVLELVKLKLKEFKGGEMVQVLEKAKNFTESQKKKILLARALYQDGDIYLLHNYLGLEDFLNDHYIITKIIKGYLKSKTVVFSGKFSRNFVNLADKALYFEDGYCIDLFKDKVLGFTLTGFPSEQGLGNMESGVQDLEELPSDPKEKFRQKLKRKFTNMKDNYTRDYRDRLFKNTYTMFKNDISRENLGNITSIKDIRKKPLPLTSLKNIQDIMSVLFRGFLKVKDKKEKGKYFLEWNEEEVYKNIFSYFKLYLKSISVCSRVLIIIFFSFPVLLDLLNNFWVTSWSLLNLKMETVFLFYGIISIAILTFVLIRDKFFYKRMLSSCSKLHNKILKNLLRVDVNWFMLRQSIRSDYKLSYDMKKIDLRLNKLTQTMIESFIFSVLGFFLINYVYFCTLIPPCFIIFLILKNLFKKAKKASIFFIKFSAENNVEMQRLYSRTLNDALSYRVTGKLGILRSKFYRCADQLQRINTHLNCFFERWIGVRFGLVYSLLALVIYSVPVLCHQFFENFFKENLIKIVIAASWSLKMVDNLDVFFFMMIKINKELGSYGRLKFFLKNIKLEKKEKKVLTKENLNNRKIVFENIQLSGKRYHGFPEVNLTIEKGKKVGFLGELDSGKIGLIQLLMGGNKQKGGVVKVFGKKITKIPNYELRRHINFITPKISIFSGKIKDNIDPKNKHKKSEIIEILNFLDAVNILTNGKKEKIIKDDFEVNLKKFKEKMTEAQKQNFSRQICYKIYNELSEEIMCDNYLRKAIEKLKSNDDFFDKNRGNFDEMKITTTKTTHKRKSIILQLKQNLRLETEEDKILMTEGVEKSTRKTEISIFGKGKNSLGIKNIEEKILEKFLDIDLKGSDTNFPMKLRKIISITRTLLNKPEIVIVDQQGIEFNTIKISQLMEKINERLGNSTIIYLLKSKDEILSFDDYVIFKDKRIVRKGAVRRDISNRERHLRNFLGNKKFEKKFKILGNIYRNERLENEIGRDEIDYTDNVDEDIDEFFQEGGKKEFDLKGEKYIHSNKWPSLEFRENCSHEEKRSNNSETKKGKQQSCFVYESNFEGEIFKKEENFGNPFFD